MIIVSSRKFRDSQNEFFKLALEEEVILKTLHYGSFRLVPLKEETKGKSRRKSKVLNDSSVIHIPDKIKTANETAKDATDNITVDKETAVKIESKQQEEMKQENIQVDIETNVNSLVLKTVAQTQTESIETAVEENKPLMIEDPSTKAGESNTNEVDEIISENIIYKSIEDQAADSETRNHTVPEEIIHVEESWKPGRVFVDPSLLSIEEVRIQEGLDDSSKKKGLFGKLFSKKK